MDCPRQVVTDLGAQFRSELFTELAKLCGSQIVRTVAYHPQINGKMKRLHRTLKAAIMAHSSKDWTTVLPTILLGLRCTVV